MKRKYSRVLQMNHHPEGQGMNLGFRSIRKMDHGTDNGQPLPGNIPFDKNQLLGGFRLKYFKSSQKNQRIQATYAGKGQSGHSVSDKAPDNRKPQLVRRSS